MGHMVVGHENTVGSTNPHVKKVEEEIVVVVMPNAIGHPWAMMVHLQNAPFADAAMVGKRGLGPVALLAPPPVKSHGRLQSLRVLLQGAAWGREDAPGMVPQHTEQQPQGNGGMHEHTEQAL
eukprot:CAMPEP_0202351144 /NCGR_PEP_ID=MMETSP1126-20121109/7918_1 /ASSEMBLY_ACC=CAM_ASM_000457 /TAXON_ID=3047 /ORGANISM="Dunaliella tertiolecta, Strain CCMP1320" /LENGTH=121 /DNA_ID=CAMNT_0048943225 /DNA_START=886 /DNA_END=1251 /DNA_ORIENTATION=-